MQITALPPAAALPTILFHAFGAPLRALDAVPLARSLAVLRDQGYGRLHIAGHDPLRHPLALELIEAGRNLGLRMTMAFAAWPGGARAAQALARLDGITASIEVAPGGEGELPDRVQRLAERGATCLHVRPAPGAPPSLQARLYLLVLALRESLPRGVRLECALAPVAQVAQRQRERAAQLHDRGPHDPRGLAQLLGEVAITADGAIKPFLAGFDARLDIASVDDCNPLALRRWRQHALPALRALVERAVAELDGQRGLVDWAAHLARASHQPLPAQGPLTPGLAHGLAGTEGVALPEVTETVDDPANSLWPASTGETTVSARSVRAA